MFHTHFNEEKKLWSGNAYDCKLDFNRESTSLGMEIWNSLEFHGTKSAQICASTGDTKTFEDLRILAIRVAKNLQRFGVERGQKIALLMDNNIDIAPLTFGSIFLGCPVLYPAVYSPAESQYFFSITKPNIIICHLKFYRMTKECVIKLKLNAKIFTVDGQTDHSIPVQNLFASVDNESYFKPARQHSDNDTIFIVQTSGTTGLKKTFGIPHGSIVQKMKALKGIFCPTDVVLKMSTLSGVSGIRCLLGATLYGSQRIVNTGAFSPARFFELTERFKPTHTQTSAYMVLQLLKDQGIERANLNSFRHFQIGGSSISFKNIRKMSNYLKNGKFCTNYGMTESFGTVASNIRHTRNNCVGQLISGYAVKIVNDQGERLGVNETGEVCIKFPFPFPGYQSGAQNKVFVDEEGFFITGDQGYFDESGDLFIDDRKKEIFKCRGCQVSPMDIEIFINDIEGIKQSCVIPIPVETDGYIAAAIVIKDEFSDCTEQSIYDAVSKNFHTFKWLDGGVYFVDFIPMTTSTKISRHLAKQIGIELYNNAIKH